MVSSNDTSGVEELPRLVSSNRVEGTQVLSRDADKVGTVAAFLIDRFSGQAEYIVVAMGGVLGIGGSYHPIPWGLVSFDPVRGAYVLTIEKAVLSGGPSFKSGSEPMLDASYIERVASYFGIGRPLA